MKYTEVEIEYNIFRDNEYYIIEWLYDNVSWESFSTTLNETLKWYRFHKSDKRGQVVTFWFLNSNDAMLFKLSWIGV